MKYSEIYDQIIKHQFKQAKINGLDYEKYPGIKRDIIMDSTITSYSILILNYSITKEIKSLKDSHAKELDDLKNENITLNKTINKLNDSIIALDKKCNQIIKNDSTVSKQINSLTRTINKSTWCRFLDFLRSMKSTLNTKK